MKEFSDEQIQKLWDKYPVNWWLRMYQKLLVKKPQDPIKPFTLVSCLIWIASFISLFIFNDKVQGFLEVWQGTLYNWIGLIIALGLTLPLIILFIISFPAFLMKNWRLRKIAKELNVSISQLETILQVSNIK
jgi:hypothetical protein